MKNRQAETAPGKVSPARIFARPTADDLWLGPTQTSALSQLSRPVPVRALLGPRSSGRTTILRHLADRSGPAVTILKLAGPERLRTGVLKGLLRSAGQSPRTGSRDALRDQLGATIRQHLAQGQRILIIVDDADTLGPAAFDELLGLRKQDGPDVHLLLSLEHIDETSSPAADFLRNEKAPSLAVVAWMSATEISWYLNWRLSRFGLASLLTPTGTQAIARSTRGCFAAVNHLSQIALLLLRQRPDGQLDEALVSEAVMTIRHPAPEAPAEHPVTTPASAPATSTPAEVELIVARGGRVVHRIPCPERLMIGRGPHNDLQLEDQYLSRHHATLMRGPTGFYITDLNSANGVFINGRRIESEPIGSDDVVRMGTFTLKLATIGQTAGSDRAPDDESLSRTWEMPAPDIPEPARLKRIK